MANFPNTLNLGTEYEIAVSSDELYIDTYLSDGTFVKRIFTRKSDSVAYCTLTPPLEWAQYNTAGRYVYITYISTLSGGGTKRSYVSHYIPDEAAPQFNGFEIIDIYDHLEKYGVFVKNESEISVSVTCTGKYGATIDKCYVGVDGQWTDASVETHLENDLDRVYTWETSTEDSLYVINEANILINIVDSRGLSADGGPFTHEVLDYSPPGITSFSSRRCDSDGTSNDQGEYIQVTFSASVTSLNDKNGAQYTLAYKKHSDSEWSTVDTSSITGSYAPNNVSFIFAADSDSVFDVSLTVADDFESVHKTATVSTAHAIMHFHSSGKGIAIGKRAETSNTLDVGYSSIFQQAVKVYGGLTVSNMLNVALTSTFQKALAVGADLNVSGNIVMLSSSYPGIYCYFAGDDEKKHSIIQRASDKLCIYVGWGSESIQTKTYVCGYWIKLQDYGGGVYSSKSISVTSDRNLKKDIYDLDDKYVNFFKLLKPVSYKYDMLHSRGVRDHVGFVAQDVEDALNESGLTTEQFAGICIQNDVDIGDEESGQIHYDKLYSLRYDEFIALNTHMIQKQQSVIEEQQKKIENLEARIEALEKIMESK